MAQKYKKNLIIISFYTFFMNILNCIMCIHEKIDPVSHVYSIKYKINPVLSEKDRAY